MKQTRLFFLGIVLSALPAIACADTAQPNIIFILADDPGSGDAKCFYPPSKVTTPNIDRLAIEGLRFTQTSAPNPLFPMNSNQFRSSRPFRQKQIPRSQRIELYLDDGVKANYAKFGKALAKVTGLPLTTLSI